MLFYILSILLAIFIFLYFLLKTKKWRYIIIFVVFILVMTFLTIYALNNKPYTLKGEESRLSELFLFLCMVLGMLANQIFNSYKSKKLQISISLLFKPILVSPIIFLFVWAVLEKMESASVVTYCFAFQNGFFWEIILKKVVKSYQNE